MNRPCGACSPSQCNNWPVIQEKHLPVDTSESPRKQLHSLAGHVAAVQGGGLHVAREFSNCPRLTVMSPSLHVVAARHIQDGSKTTVAALPSERACVDVQQLLNEGQHFKVPASGGWQATGSARCNLRLSTRDASLPVPALGQLQGMLNAHDGIHACLCMHAAGSDRMWACRWCSGGTHMILTSHRPGSPEMY